MTSSGRFPRGDARSLLAASTRLPEVVGALVSVVVLGVLLAGGPFGATTAATRSSAPSAPPASLARTPAPTLLVDAALVNLLATVNDKLASTAARLAAQTGIRPFPTADAASAVRELNSTARSALELIPQMERQPGASVVAAHLRAFYESITSTATSGLQASVTNAAAYAATARDLGVILDALPGLQAELQAVLLLPPGSAPPTGSPTPPPSPLPSNPASPGSSSQPSGSPQPPGGPELIVNGRFDGGSRDPWALKLDGGVTAQFALDSESFGSSAPAARITISTATTSRGAVALRQFGIPIAAGATYVLRVAIAAARPREVSLRVASLDGVTYGSTIIEATTVWTTYELEFSAPFGDPAALVSIEFGRSAATAWVDDVSLRETFGVVAP